MPGERAMSDEAESLEEVEEQESQEQVDDIEERARTMGWAPKEEFRGDQRNWVDAETFLERGEKSIPVLKERYRALETKFNEMEKTLKEFAKHHKEVSDREYKRALEDIRKQKAEAVRLGDADAYEKAESQEDRLRESKPKAIEVKEDGVHPDWHDWVAENTWYTQDRTAKILADAVAQEMLQTHSHLHGRAFFDAVKARVKQELPHKFENPRRKAAPAVEGAGGGKPKSNGKSYSDLPAEARKACDDFVKQGLLSKEQYVKEYFGS